MPVPLSATVCGLAGASSVKERDALRAPVAVGAKVTLTVQVALTATVAPVQVSALLPKSPALVPVKPTEVICKLVLPLLVTVTVWAGLVVPVPWLPKLRLVGLKLVPGARATPVPLRATVCGLLGA